MPANFLGSKAVDRSALLAGVRRRIHMPAIRYSIVSSWLVRPITSANMARQLLSKAAAYSSNSLDNSIWHDVWTKISICTVHVPHVRHYLSCKQDIAESVCPGHDLQTCPASLLTL